MSADPLLAGRTLLVLAASVQQVPLIRRLRTMGARIVTLDNRPENPGHALAHTAHIEDVRDVPAVLRVIAAEGVEGVIAAASDVAVETAAAVGAVTGLVAPPLAATAAMLSKADFRRAQRRFGLPAPDWAEDIGATPRPGPWIVKPSRGSGSRGIRLVTSEAELPAALADARAQSLDGQAMFECLLPGTQHTAEGWVQAGRIAAMLVTHRETAPAPLVATLGHRVPIAFPGPAEAALRTDLERLLDGLGYRDGPFDADVVLTPDGPVLIEISARTGGNGLMQLVEAATGQDVIHLIGLHALGRLPVLEPWRIGPAGVDILADPRGGVLEYDAGALPALRAEPWLHDLTLDLPPGARVAPFTDGRCRFGQVVVSGGDAAQVEHRLQEVRRRLRLGVA